MKEWSAFLDAQSKTVGNDAIERWARTLKVVHFDAGNLYLEAADLFQLNWFEQYLRPLIKNGLLSTSGRPIRIHLTLQGAQQKSKKEWKPPLDLTPDSLFIQCTFDTYFPGTTNDAHFKLFYESIVQKSFNPIYLQGPHGVGKTHLLMSVCHHYNRLGKSSLYVKADRFTQHIVAAIRSGSMQMLREKYRKHDLLVIDEIESLQDRSASQEELFHTFNTLHLAGKQILLAGSALPSELKGIEPRLTSRFEWGLVLSLKPLSEEDLKAYLLSRNKIPTDMIDLLVTLFPSIPLLNRASDIIAVRSKETKPTPALLQTWLDPLIQEQQKKALTPDVILKAVASHFDIHFTELQGRSQTQEHATPRQVAMYLLRSQLKLPYMKIAELFSRDHSTVMTSVKIIEKRLQDNASIQHAIKNIQEEILQ